MGRRKKGYKGPEGLIKIPGSPNWYIKKEIFGKTIFKTTGTSDVVQAEVILHLVIAELMKDFEDTKVNQILGKSVPFRTAVDRYLKEISPSKSKGGRNDINSSKAVLAYFDIQPIDTITKQDIYKYLDSRKETVSDKTGRPLSGSAVNREKSFISEVFRKSIRWGYVNENPVTDIEGFSENKRERYITDEEFSKLLKHMSADLQDLFLCLYHTGQRNGRIYNLQWSQIDLNVRSITFKNTSSNKKVPNVLWINNTLYAIFMKRRKNRRTLSPFVFYSKNMTPYSDSNIRREWGAACKTAKVSGARPYDIRHKSITDMKKAGHTDPFVGKVAGHSDPRTTNRYTHFSIDETMAPLSALDTRSF